MCFNNTKPNLTDPREYKNTMAARVALSLSCVCKTFTTSSKDHSGHLGSSLELSHCVQEFTASMEHAKSPRCVSVKLKLTKSTLHSIDTQKMVPIKIMVVIISPINKTTAPILYFLSREFNILKDEMNQPNNAEIRKVIPQIRYTTPIHAELEFDAI